MKIGKDLFSPVKLGPYELRNRLVMAPLTRNRTGPGKCATAPKRPLHAQRAKLSAEDEQIKAETAVTVAMVSLYRAFGGGWDSNEQQDATSMPQPRGNPKVTVRNRGNLNLSVR